jgi:hypothetical protein
MVNNEISFHFDFIVRNSRAVNAPAAAGVGAQRMEL